MNLNHNPNPNPDLNTNPNLNPDPNFLKVFKEVLEGCLTRAESRALEAFQSNAPGANLETVLENMSADEKLITTLSSFPLKDCENFVSGKSRVELGMEQVYP